jgi:hypothetical protein
MDAARMDEIEARLATRLLDCVALDVVGSSHW